MMSIKDQTVRYLSIPKKSPYLPNAQFLKNELYFVYQVIRQIPKPSFGSAWVTGNITSMTIYEYTDEESPTGGTVYTYGYTNSAWGD